MNFVIQRDKRDLFRFAALQSERGIEIISENSFDSYKQDTFILFAGDKLYTKSTAALMICKELNGLIKILFPLIILPEFFRDFFYDLIAKKRYKLFGKRESCRIPTEEDKLKFLE